MEFFDSLFSLVFSSSGTYQGDARYSVVSFAAASSFYGSLVVLLDIIIVKALARPSLLKLSYPNSRVIIMFLVWGIGAGIGGILGAAAGIFQVNRLACLVVGASWPLILPRILASSENQLSTERVIPESQ